MTFLLIMFWPITLPIFIGYAFMVYKLFKKQYYLILIIVAILPYIAFSSHQYVHYSGIIPAKIGITFPVAITEEGGFREGCGSAVFRVSDETLEKIQSEGLGFFTDALQQRGNTERKFEEWKETPVPSSWTSEGSWIACSSLSTKQHIKIIEAAKQPGAFYTIGHESELILVPSLGYIIFSFFG